MAFRIVRGPDALARNSHELMLSSQAKGISFPYAQSSDLDADLILLRRSRLRDDLHPFGPSVT